MKNLFWDFHLFEVLFHIEKYNPVLRQSSEIGPLVWNVIKSSLKQLNDGNYIII